MIGSSEGISVYSTMMPRIKILANGNFTCGGCCSLDGGCYEILFS